MGSSTEQTDEKYTINNFNHHKNCSRDYFRISDVLHMVFPYFDDLFNKFNMQKRASISAGMHEIAKGNVLIFLKYQIDIAV